MPASHSQIENIIADLDSALGRLGRLVSEIPDEQWEKRNDPKSWSVAECIEHLNMTSRAYLPLLRKGLDSAPPLKIPRAFRRDPVGVLLGALTAPIRKVGGFRLGRMPTTREFEPRGALLRDQVSEEFENHQRELIAIARDAQEREIDRVKIASPFNAKVKYNMYSALRIIAGHEHRHLEQAEAVWGSGVRPANR